MGAQQYKNKTQSDAIVVIASVVVLPRLDTENDRTKTNVINTPTTHSNNETGLQT